MKCAWRCPFSELCVDGDRQGSSVVFTGKENLSVHLGIRPSSAERCGLPEVLLLTHPELSASDVLSLHVTGYISIWGYNSSFWLSWITCTWKWKSAVGQFCLLSGNPELQNCISAIVMEALVSGYDNGSINITCLKGLREFNVLCHRLHLSDSVNKPRMLSLTHWHLSLRTGLIAAVSFRLKKLRCPLHADSHFHACHPDHWSADMVI